MQYYAEYDSNGKLAGLARTNKSGAAQMVRPGDRDWVTVPGLRRHLEGDDMDYTAVSRAAAVAMAGTLGLTINI